MMNSIFVNIGLIIVVATFFAYFARIIKQPLIPFYILTGVILGPVLQIITDIELIKLLSEIGIAFLLFVVGVELNLKKLKSIGIVSIFGSTIRMAIMFMIGFVIALGFGFVFIESIYIAIILAFSSTMVVIKLLSDKHQLDTLHGRIIIGFLLMEDIVAILILSTLGTIDNFTPLLFLSAIGKGLALLGIAFLCAKYIFPNVFKFAARSQEFFFIMALAVMFFFSMLAYGMDFSIAIGAFIAGVCLAHLPYNFEIIGKVKPLKDFFAILFFVSLGMELMFSSLVQMAIPLLVFSVIIIIAKPLITMGIVSFFEYTKRTSFMTAINLAQISEFSLIIALQGVMLGHISHELFSFIIMLAIISIGITPYFNKYSNRLYEKVKPQLSVLNIFGRGLREKGRRRRVKAKFDVIVIGFDRIGYRIVRALQKMKTKYIIVDFNPDIIRKLQDKRIPYMYGDVSDSEIMDRLDFDSAKMVVCTAPSYETNMLVIKHSKVKNPKTLVFVTAYNVEDALQFYEEGADYVVLPHFLGGDHAALILEESSSDIKQLFTKRLTHIRELKKRLKMGHRHPTKEMH